MSKECRRCKEKRGLLSYVRKHGLICNECVYTLGREAEQFRDQFEKLKHVSRITGRVQKHDGIG